MSRLAGLDRIGPAALRRPRIALALLLAVLLASAAALPRLRFDDDINRVFLSDSALSQAQRRLDTSLAPTGRDLAVLIDSPDPISIADLSRLRDLSLDLELTDGVLGVLSPFALRFPPGSGQSGAPLFDDTLDAAAMDARLDAFRARNTGLPPLLRPDRRSLLLLVSVAPDRAVQAEAAVRLAVAQALPAGLRAGIAGEDLLARDIAQGLKRDLLLLNGAGAALLVLAALLLLNGWRLAVLATLPGVLGALAVLGLAGWLGFPITVISNVVPILILILGVSNGVHLALHLKDSAAPDPLAETLARVGPACALSSLTTALAFSTILLTGNAQLREFALLGAAGMVLAFAVLIATFALLARRLPPGPPRPVRLAPALARRLFGAGQRAPRAVIAAGLALTLLGAVGWLTARPWFPLYQNLPAGSASAAAADRVAGDFGGVFQMLIELDTAGEQALDTPAGWARYAGVVTAVARDSDGPVLSLLALSRWAGTPGSAPDAATLGLLPPHLAQRLRPDAGTARLIVPMPEPMRSPATLARYDRIDAAARAAGADRVLGLPAVMRHESVTLIRQLSLSLVTAAIAATAIIALALGSWRLIPALALPNVLPILLAATSLHLVAGGLLTPTAVLALTIAFGIAVDDTIHFTSRFTALTAAGMPRPQALNVAAETAGPAMVLTTLLLICGLAVTLFSVFQPIRLFGGLLIFSLAVALVLDLTLLPAMLSRMRSRP